MNSAFNLMLIFFLAQFLPMYKHNSWIKILKWIQLQWFIYTTAVAKKMCMNIFLKNLEIEKYHIVLFFYFGSFCFFWYLWPCRLMTSRFIFSNLFSVSFKCAKTAQHCFDPHGTSTWTNISIKHSRSAQYYTETPLKLNTCTFSSLLTKEIVLVVFQSRKSAKLIVSLKKSAA